MQLTRSCLCCSAISIIIIIIIDIIIRGNWSGNNNSAEEYMNSQNRIRGGRWWIRAKTMSFCVTRYVIFCSGGSVLYPVILKIYIVFNFINFCSSLMCDVECIRFVCSVCEKRGERKCISINYFRQIIAMYKYFKYLPKNADCKIQKSHYRPLTDSISVSSSSP